jgi:flavin reductase (DIM6/NTAB) family NADH-FMN oxidoreductase RutF
MLDVEEFRKAIRTFTTGVTVVTFPTADGMHGMTASSFASVSVLPHLVLVSIAKEANAHPHMLAADAFGINLLLESQHDLANYFAGKTNERVAIPYRWVGASPVLEESLGWFACRVYARYAGGDHTILVGEVGAFERTDERPLVCSRGHFHALGQRTAGTQPDPALITTT